MSIRLLSLIMALSLSVLLSVKAQTFDVQGHRGARGLMPENTLPAFLEALAQGVTTLELDVVISKDSAVVVSHEPHISALICKAPNGDVPLGEAQEDHNEKTRNIYRMTYAEVKTYDCGTLAHPRFPHQEKINTYKPLLSEVFREVEQYIKDHGRKEVNYNIELKSSPKGDGVHHPGPGEFSELVHDLVGQYIPYNRLIIQSFDFRVLRYWHEKYPDIRLAALVENRKGIDTHMEELGFVPDIYSPYYRLLNRKKIRILKERGTKVIPWTVNRKRRMQRLKRSGVDGLITDYPDRAKFLR